MKKSILFPMLFAFLTGTFLLWAQRGLPPDAKIRFVLVTKYDQHLDFLSPTVKLLKIPNGRQVNMTAAGPCRPRMLYPGPNGALCRQLVQILVRYESAS